MKLPQPLERPQRLEPDGRRSKHPRVVDIVLSGESVGTANEISSAMKEEANPNSRESAAASLASSLGVNTLEEHSMIDGHAIKTTLVTNEVLQWYMKAEERLHKDLKEVSMEDHD